MASQRPSTSMPRAGQSSRAPARGESRAPEGPDGRRPSAGALALDGGRRPSAGALALDGGRSSRPPPPGREIVTSIPAAAPVPDFWHVRGHVLRATDQFVLAAHGAAIRDRILAQLPSRFSDDFRHGSLAGVVLYDLAIYEAYAAAANSIVLGDEPSSWREIGRAGVEGELASLMRTVSQSADEAALFRRCTTMWSRLADFGAWSTEHLGEGETVVRVVDFSMAPITLRQWLIGVVEQTLRNAGYAGTTVAARIGDASRTSELELLVRLRS
jgi:eukaryotic-like serine/threonine-protein kinase